MVELKKMISDVEKIVLSDDQLDAGFTLYDIEMAIESNPDYYAYFESEDGRFITKFDIERELNKIKTWIYERVRFRASQRRFSKFR
jgi:hypothetical protein